MWSGRRGGTVDLSRRASARRSARVAPERFAIAGAAPRSPCGPTTATSCASCCAPRRGMASRSCRGAAALGRARRTTAPAALRTSRSTSAGSTDSSSTSPKTSRSPPSAAFRSRASRDELARTRAVAAARVRACRARDARRRARARTRRAPRRLRFGAPRDRILGARFVLGRRHARAHRRQGGEERRGLRIHRLLCGSRGGLAIMVDASLKLLPAPAVRRALVYDVRARELVDRRALGRSLPRLEPAWVTVLSGAIARASLPAAAGTRRSSAGRRARGRADTHRGAAHTHGPGARRARARAIGRRRGRLRERLADLEDHAACRARATRPPPLTPPPSRRARPATRRTCVFHAACGRLHVFPDAAGGTSDRGRERALRPASSHEGAGTEPARRPPVAIRSRAAANPGGARPRRALRTGRALGCDSTLG